MLDLSVVKMQIDQMIDDRRLLHYDFEKKLAIALREFKRWSGRWRELSEKLSRSNTSWLLPDFLDGLGGAVPFSAPPDGLSVAATDGSQIYPDRHEVAPCFLINMGYILLHYDSGEKPIINSKPMLFYQDDDIVQEWDGVKTYVNQESVNAKRNALELTELTELSIAAKVLGHNVVSLSDGTLIEWALEGKPRDYRSQMLSQIIASFDRMEQENIPIAGYISQTGSQELVNALKIGLCPTGGLDCKCCPRKSEVRKVRDTLPLKDENTEISPIEGVTDAMLMRCILKPYQRTPIYRSNSKILRDYGKHWIHFFYVNTGDEIGRVEMPRWVATDSKLLNLVHSCVCDQIIKGRGYPVALAEAHEIAVVRAADRDAFYGFLRNAFVDKNFEARISTKSFKKRYLSI